MTPPLLGILQGQQDLSDSDAVPGERLLISMGKADLTGRGGGLLLLEPEPVSVESQMAAADCDRAGGNQDHLLAAGPAARNVFRQQVEPAMPDLAIVGHQQGRADLDHQPPGRRQRFSRGSLVSCFLSVPGAGEGFRQAVADCRHASTRSSHCRAARSSTSTANSAASTSGTPAPETPDNGMTAVPRPAARRNSRIFPSITSASSASILLSPTISGFSVR